MAKDMTVAPKERINIKYVSDTGGVQKSIELPFRMAVMGDFTLREDETSIEDRKPVDVNKENFNEVLSAHNVKMDLTVDDTLSGEEGGQLNVSIPVNHMNDFKPEAVAQNVPELKKLLDLRDSLRSTKAHFSKSDFSKNLEKIIADPAQRQKLMDELGMGEEGGE